MIANSVFNCIRIVGMRWAINIFEVVIVVRVLVLVPNDKPDGTSGRFSLKYSRKKLYFIGLFTGGGNGRLSGTAAISLSKVVRVDSMGGG